MEGRVKIPHHLSLIDNLPWEGSTAANAAPTATMATCSSNVLSAKIPARSAQSQVGSGASTAAICSAQIVSMPATRNASHGQQKKKRWTSLAERPMPM